MTAQLLDGEAVAATIKADLRHRIAALEARGHTPGLGTLLVGDDGPSANYVAMKHRDCAEIGIGSVHEHLPATASQDDVLEEILVRDRLDSTRPDAPLTCAEGATRIDTTSMGVDEVIEHLARIVERERT